MLMFLALSPAMGASVLAQAVPINFWLLQRGRESLDMDVGLCATCCASATPAELQASLEALAVRPGVAVETEANALAKRVSWSSTEVAEEITGAGLRSFLLPGGELATVNEIDFSDGGTGARVWDTSIAMSIWLRRKNEELLGCRLLELGAGVGLTGISAALQGADVTLSELGEELPSSLQQVSGGAATACSTRRLLPNLEANLLSNGLTSSLADAAAPVARAGVAAPEATRRGRARTLALNWEACLEDGFAIEQYDVVLGSDLVYEGFAVEALVAALMQTVRRGGVAYLMSASTRFKKGAGALTLLKALKADGTVSLETMVVHNSFGRTQCLLVEWRRAEAAGGEG